jgi:hypothetical protein
MDDDGADELIEFDHVLNEVMVAMPERVLLEMLRQVTVGADPDFVYMEFFANENFYELTPVDCDCECTCRDDQDDCDCCSCEDDDAEPTD